VLVTGAAKRLGREIALALAAAGWQVAVHYRGSAAEAARPCRLRRALGRPASALSRPTWPTKQATRALLPRVARASAPSTRWSTAPRCSSTTRCRPSATRCRSAPAHQHRPRPSLLAQALHAPPRTRGAQGAVVNLLDQKLWNPNPDFLSYTLSKAALEAATTDAGAGAGAALRVVGVAPGLTLTSHMLSQDKFEQLHKLSPLGRSSTPADVVATVRFALENRSITGTTLLVDGGQHLMKFDRDFSLM
jgi:NAD(P)-dependent dehydrogenase (short-subunit alcohol dehydrogenase family)